MASVVAARLAPDRGLRRVLVGLAPISFAVQACSFVSSIALTRVLGASAGTDAYYLGLSVPVASYAILMTAVRLGAIPALTECDGSASPMPFARAASDVFSATLAASLLMTVVVTAIAEVVIPLAVGGQTGATSRLVMLELAPLGVLGAATGALGAILAVRRVFIPTVAVLLIEPVLKTVLTVALGHRIGINALIIGNVVGSTCAAGVLWLKLRSLGIQLHVRLHFDTTFVRGVVAVSAPLVVSQSFLQTNPIVDRTMAGSLGAGSVTALEIGLRICLVPAALVTGLMISPITATWADRRLRHGWPALRTSLARATVAIAMFTPPLVVLGLVLRHEIVGFVYQGGAYSSHALAETSRVFAMTVIALPAQLLAVVISTLFIVEKATVFPMIVGIANVVLNVALNFALRPSLGVGGIALSTTVTIVLLTIVYVVAAQRRWNALQLRPHIWPISVSLGSTCVVAVVAILVLRMLPEASSRSTSLLAIAVVGGIGLGLHALLVGGRDPSVRLALRMRRSLSGGGA